MQDWIEGLITWVLQHWDAKLQEVIDVITQDPSTFYGGGPWGVLNTVHGVLVGVGLAMVMLFFAIGFFENTLDFRDFKKPERLLKHFIRFAVAKGLVQHSLAVMIWIFNMVKGMILQIAPSSFGATPPLNSNVQTAIDELGFFKSIPAWLIVMIGALVIVGLSFVIVLQVYGRFFKVYMYAAVSPLILSSYAWVGMGGNTTRHFLKSFFGVCLEGLLIVVACLIYQSMVLNPADPYVTGDSPIMYLMQYMAQSIFNMLILIGTVKLTSTLVREMMGS